MAVTLEQIAAKLDRNYQLNKRIEEMLKTTESEPRWVRMITVMKETGKGREWVRQQREMREDVARKKENGRYEYDLNAYKKIAA